jgi:hypothetical protein
MKEAKIPSAVPLVIVIPALLLALLAGCETAQQSAARLPKGTPTRIAFNTNDTLYTGGLGKAGVEGFCKRIQNYLVKDLADRGITAAPNSAGDRAYAQITVTLSSIEAKGGGGVGLGGVFSSFPGHTHVKYSAALQSPSGATVATWRHELEEETVDKLSEHIAADIAKYLSRGFH